MVMKFRPDQDGRTHINIYSKGLTELGRNLTNFAHTPIETTDGSFASLEAWWYWQLGNPEDPKRESLRGCIGFRAKQLGRELGIPDWPPHETLPEFKTKFREAARAKLDQHPELADAVRGSSLPFVHYYCWGKPLKVVCPKEAEWITQTWEELREELIALDPNQA